jgi:hypothetical protein
MNAGRTSDGSMPSNPVGAVLETSKTAESAAADVGAREREEAGAEMSLPSTTGWDRGCPMVRPFGLMFSSTCGTEHDPLFLRFLAIYSHWSAPKAELKTINGSYYMVLGGFRAQLEMLLVLPQLFFPLCREYLVTVLRARVGTGPSCLMGEAPHAGKKDQIYQPYSAIQMAHTRDLSAANASAGNSLSMPQHAGHSPRI